MNYLEMAGSVVAFSVGTVYLGFGIKNLCKGNKRDGIYQVCLGAISLVGGAYLMNTREERCQSIWDNKDLFMDQISKEYDFCKLRCQNEEPNTRIDCLLNCFKLDDCRVGTFKQNIYGFISSLNKTFMAHSEKKITQSGIIEV